MSPEQHFRDFAAVIGRYRFNGAEHLITFLDELRREALRRANEMGARVEPLPPARREVRSGRVTQTTIEVSGRRVMVQRRAQFAL